MGRAILPNKDLCDACGQPRASPQPAAKAAPKGPKVGSVSKGWGFLGISRFGLVKKNRKKHIIIY